MIFGGGFFMSFHGAAITLQLLPWRQGQRASNRFYDPVTIPRGVGDWQWHWNCGSRFYTAFTEQYYVRTRIIISENLILSGNRDQERRVAACFSRHVFLRTSWNEG